MKIIFLDVDGVLNCLERWDSLPDVSRKGSKVCPEATARLKRLVDATGAKIVVSSTWRHSFMAELTAWLCKNGIASGTVVGRTPLDSELPSGVIVLGHERGHEIQAWLNDNQDVTSFVILDDGADMAHLADRLVQTTWLNGLQDEHVNQAIGMLA